MSEWLEEFEELLDKVISYGDATDFEIFKEKVIERLEDIY